MKETLLIQNPLMCAPMTDERSSMKNIKTFSGGHIFIENGKIKSIGPQEFNGTQGSPFVTLPVRFSVSACRSLRHADTTVAAGCD